MDTVRCAGAPPYRGRPGSGAFRECITALVVTGGARVAERRGRDRRAGPACSESSARRSPICAPKSSNVETRLIRWMAGTVIATGALTVGILRFFG